MTTDYPAQNTNEAPYPMALQGLVDKLEYRPGWRVWLDPKQNRGQGSRGLTLCILVKGFDSYDVAKGENFRVLHLMPVPPAAYNERSWRRWLFDQLVLVERHEAAEFFVIAGERPYAPHHGDGNDPYAIVEQADADELEAMRRR